MLLAPTFKKADQKKKVENEVDIIFSMDLAAIQYVKGEGYANITRD